RGGGGGRRRRARRRQRGCRGGAAGGVGRRGGRRGAVVVPLRRATCHGTVLGALLALAALLLPFPGVAHRATAQEDWSEVVRGDPSTGIVALTFDAGGVAGPAAAQIIGILRDRHVRATFFLSGHWVDDYPDLALQVAADGHELANHTYNHPDLALLDTDRIV